MKHATLNPSRDPRVEDPSNLWLIDPLARLLVPAAVRLRISANVVSITGVLVGGIAALAYMRWQQPGWAMIGLLITIVWLVMDSLDGMVARATDTCSAFGRELDGLCDHGVFTLIYLALAASVGGGANWALMFAAGGAHAIQANLYEAERGRFHRRINGNATAPATSLSRNPAIRFYDWLAARFGSAATPLDQQILSGQARSELRRRYERVAVPVLQAMLPLTQNMRLFALFVACAMGHMTLFFWYEIIPLTVLTMASMMWHRSVEAGLLRQM